MHSPTEDHKNASTKGNGAYVSQRCAIDSSIRIDVIGPIEDILGSVTVHLILSRHVSRRNPDLYSAQKNDTGTINKLSKTFVHVHSPGLQLIIGRGHAPLALEI